MNHKLEMVVKKNRKIFIIAIVLWFVIAIVLVAPISYSIIESKIDGVFNIQMFVDNMGSSITNPIKTLTSCFSANYASTFGDVLLKVSIGYVIIAIIGIIKSVPKDEYVDIEHGSSDWCEHGEQYKILNNKQGILLAEKHYLPIDKIGNTNVLVVGRFWFW